MQYSQFDDCDIRNQFEAFVVNLGISPAPGTVFLTDGLLHEFDIQGDRIGSGNGRYTLHADGLPSGWVRDWKRGIVYLVYQSRHSFTGTARLLRQ